MPFLYDFDYFLDKCLIIGPHQTLHILKVLSFYNINTYNLKDIQETAHGENDDSFDRSTFMARENSLVLFTVK